MSISTKIPHLLLHYPNSPSLKTLKSPKLTFSRSITIEKISTKSVSASSSSSSSQSLQPIEEFPPKLQEIIKLFQSVEQPKAKYEQLLFYGKNLKPLDSKYKTSENKVQGCVSQVWVRAYFDSERRRVFFEADSDSVLTKGLAALLVQGLSGRSVEEIVKVSPDFAVLLGLQQSLTPSRNNGFLNMLELMQKKALQLYVEAEEGESEISTAAASSTEGSSNGVNGNVESVAIGDISASVGGGDDDGGVLKSRGMRIKEKLEKELRPIELQVEDVSYQHAGHAGIRGSDDGETHFNLKVVSDEFEGKSLVKRHRMIYGLLQDELQNGLHALSIEAKTPSEFGGSPGVTGKVAALETASGRNASDITSNLHQRSDYLNSCVIFSVTARSYNVKFDSWEPPKLHGLFTFDAAPVSHRNRHAPVNIVEESEQHREPLMEQVDRLLMFFF